MEGYKFVQADLISKFDSSHEVWEIGKWRKAKGRLEMCKNGFHACQSPYDALSYNYGPRFFKVQTDGKQINDSDKFCVRKMRLVEEIPSSVIVDFAIACAEHVLPIWLSEYPEDDRPAKAIEAAKKMLKDPAAWAAAWPAAWAAARAAGAAAGDAARAAAGDAERKWQNETFLAIIAKNENKGAQ